MSDPPAESDPFDDLRSATMPRTAAPLDVPLIELTVEIERRKAAERKVVLEGDLLRIGSHPSNDLVLDDPAVSRFHCRLTRGSRGWAVTDTGSLNGTQVNGVRVRDADLGMPECRLQIGDSRLAVRDAGSRHASAPPLAVTFGALLGASLPMRRLFDAVVRVAPKEATVLILGESGTGKELIAHEIVRRSARAGKPFVVLDCASIAPSVLESELFGHARGAFTGADRERFGAFEAASGGTLFLDEIGELPLEMQPKLLRAIEAGQVRRMGENRFRSVDVRLIAATHRQIERDVNRDTFRGDLFYRLSVVTLRVPPLRERREDIPLLVEAFLASLEASDRRDLFPPDLLAALSRHAWPGNVRELRNFVERRVILDGGDPGPSSLFPPPLSSPSGARDDGISTAPPEIQVPFRQGKAELIAQFERSYLSALMRWADDNISRAARKGKDRQDAPLQAPLSARFPQVGQLDGVTRPNVPPQ